MSVATRTGNAPGLEALQGLGALGLAAVAVDASGGHPVAREVVGQAVGPVLGAGEHEDAPDVAPLQQLDEQRRLQLGWARGTRPG